jgi:arginyl-tRNA synthetase
MIFENEQKDLEQQITAYLELHNLPEMDFKWSWIPFNGEWGFSLSFFQLAAKTFGPEKGNVGQKAREISEGIADYLSLPDGFSKVQTVNGYLNFYFSPLIFSTRVVDSVLDQKDKYGWSESNGKSVMFEFSHPNTHKAFHVGHLRGAILGDVLCRLQEAAGYEVIRANYPGDIGLHVIKWLWNYLKFHKGEKPSRDITRWMGDLYAEASKRLEEDHELEQEVRATYAKWDQRDPEVVNTWRETREWSLEGFHEMYETLDIRFDRYYFNSMFEDPGKEMVNELIKKGIAQDERPIGGAVIVKLDEKLGLKEEKYRVAVVLRSDGTALYATEDLALARQKFNDYPELEKSWYVVDVRQSLHFQQVFKTLELAGYDWAQRCGHIPYELVNLPGNVVIASREGNVVLLEDLIREATTRALEVVSQKNPDLSDPQKLEVARTIGIGSIKYPMLSRESTKLVTFDWQSALDFNGQAAPYIQYAYVRGTSILKKVHFVVPLKEVPEYDLSTSEITLVDLISRMPGEVQKAAKDLKPLVISSLAYELARAFNDFYTQCPVLQADEATRNFRLRLVAAARQAIGNSLALLGITAPQAM